jgi:putative oxidoreductase
MDVVFLIGRLLFVFTFVESGFKNHLAPHGVEYARMKGAPLPEILVPASGIAIIVGGLSVALGIWADLGALVMAAFLVGITPIMHAYWKLDDQQEQINQRVNFTKNVALIGGALILFYIYNQLQGDAGLSLTDPVFGRAD